jgi:hypothetical protein
LMPHPQRHALPSSILIAVLMLLGLRGVLAEIEQELRSQYLGSYLSTVVKARDKMRKIKIELVNPELLKQGLQLSYQQGYFTR